VSRELARRGARVIVAARGMDAIEQALGDLGDGGHEGLSLDVSDAAAWPDALATVDAGGELSGLVTAAGVLGPIGPLETVDVAEAARTIATNLGGTMLALLHAIPRLRATGGRAVTFSGGGATSPRPGFDAYAASKAAVVRLTENIAAAGSIEANCVAPGPVATRMQDAVLAAANPAGGGFPATEAAQLVCFLLSDEAAGITGRLLSAQWDPWRDEEFRRRLRTERDLATLRRIDDAHFRSAG
jgi:NAD(P)-dependent dehydrogenase (short-subunit alcohol dehydrogenase family)